MTCRKSFLALFAQIQVISPRRFFPGKKTGLHQLGDAALVLYMDFFPRASKKGGAWCGSYRSQTYKDGKKVAPVVTVVCNFTKPAAGQPALLSADEANTLFHEFGHALHNLFKDVLSPLLHLCLK